MSSPIRDAVHVTSADFVRHFGSWQDRASKDPVVITHHGRERLVVLSPERFAGMASNCSGPVVPDDRGSGAQGQADLGVVGDYLDECFIAFDQDLRVEQVNAAACSYLRMARSQLEGRSVTLSVPQWSGSLASANIIRALEGGVAATLEVQSVLYPGRWLRVKTFRFSAGSACLFRDVTDEVEARDAIDIQLATRQALLAHGAVGRCVLTVRATFRDVDAGFAALLDLAPEGLLRARFTDIFPVNCRAEAREFIEMVLETGQTATLDTKLLRRGHAQDEVRLSAAALTGGHDRGAVVIATLR